ATAATRSSDGGRRSSSPPPARPNGAGRTDAYGSTMSNRAHYLVATPILAMLLVACASKHPPLPTVESVDLDRYQGTWYEIASIPVPEQEGCYGTTASYAVRGDGTVDVLNRCLKGAKAEPSIARGTAIPKEGTNNSQLEVNFFGPFGGDYYIVALDPDYEYAMVAVP